MKKILFVCLGNICRSPAAEGVFIDLLKKQGLEDSYYVDSAGTSGYHEGERADSRMREHAKQRGIELLSRSRPVLYPDDFQEFDLIIPMDDSNLQNLYNLDAQSQYRCKIKKMTDFCLERTETEVPDPYFGGPKGFDQVLDILEDACAGLLETLRE